MITEVKKSVFDKLDVIESNNEQQEFSADLEELKEEVSAIDDMLIMIKGQVKLVKKEYEKTYDKNPIITKMLLKSIENLIEVRERLY